MLLVKSMHFINLHFGTYLHNSAICRSILDISALMLYAAITYLTLCSIKARWAAAFESVHSNGKFSLKFQLTRHIVCPSLQEMLTRS